MVQDENTIQELPLPTVILPSINSQDIKKVIVTSKVLKPLFPDELLSLQTIGDLEVNLSFTAPANSNNTSYNWEYEENFPEEFDPSNNSNGTSLKTYNFKFPVIKFQDTLIFSIDENFLQISPIFSTVIALKLSEYITSLKNVELYVMGVSDKVTDIRTFDQDKCTLIPPELVVGFIGAFLSDITLKKLPFKCLVAPSEGPLGFEKLTLATMEQLVRRSEKLISSANITTKEYETACNRHWRLSGTTIGAQAGLYI